MREILFRGKNADNGEWVYGSYFAHQKIRLCIVRDESEVEENTQHLIVQDALACDWGFKNGMQVVDVLPETVGEYTGLTDKNGKKIFEGDFIKSNSERGYIEYYPNDCAFDVVDDHGFCWLISEMSNIEIVGNIHDNPELLEEKK